MPTAPSGRVTAWSRGTRSGGDSTASSCSKTTCTSATAGTRTCRASSGQCARYRLAGWWGLYLGHVPIQVYFVRGGLLRTRSGCTHAYLANQPLLNWLATTPPMGADVPTWPLIGQSIDSAMSSLPELYALFPMIARQRFLGDYRVDSSLDDRGRRRSFADSLADARMVAPASRPLPDAGRGSESLTLDVRAGLFDGSQAESRVPEMLIGSIRP
jgi:hypothetical protein